MSGAQQSIVAIPRHAGLRRRLCIAPGHDGNTSLSDDSPNTSIQTRTTPSTPPASQRAGKGTLLAGILFDAPRDATNGSIWIITGTRWHL